MSAICYTPIVFETLSILKYWLEFFILGLNQKFPIVLKISINFFPLFPHGMLDSSEVLQSAVIIGLSRYSNSYLSIFTVLFSPM